jgi:hypothetical protein
MELRVEADGEKGPWVGRVETEDAAGKELGKKGLDPIPATPWPDQQAFT